MAFKRPVRSRPIRVFLISMFAVPLVSLLALWGFAASITVSNAVSDHQYNVSAAAIASGVRGLTIGLPQERAQSYLWLISGGTAPKASLLAARQIVDQGIPAVHNALSAQQGLLSAESRSELNTLFTELGQLRTTRAAIDSGAMTPAAAFNVYNNIIDHLFLYFDTSIQDRGASLTGISVGAADSGYAFEMTTREIALVGGALLDHGQMSETARTQFASSVANRRLLMNESLALMTPSLRAGYVSLENSPAYRQFQTMENQILASTGGTVPVKPGAWQSASLAVVGSMEKTELDNGNQLTTMSASLSDRLVLEAALAGGLGLAAVAASVFLLVWFGRKVTRDLGGLNDSVREMATDRLPRVVERLRRGDDVDVDAESPRPGTSGIQEVSRIAESFGTVQAAAVSAAVDQARLRKGVNQVFLNISMRNQSLLHRQLAMLDSMERRTSIASCRCSRDWLRMEMFRKTWLTPLRSLAWSTAAETAAAWTVLNDSAIREISPMLLVPGGGDSASTSTSTPRRSRSTTLGSRSVAISRTLSFSPVRSLVTLRPNHTSRKTEATTAASPRPPTRTASRTSRLLSDALIAVSLLPFAVSTFCKAASVASEALAQAPAFTGTGPLLARTCLSMASNCW